MSDPQYLVRCLALMLSGATIGLLLLVSLSLVSFVLCPPRKRFTDKAPPR